MAPMPELGCVQQSVSDDACWVASLCCPPCRAACTCTSTAEADRECLVGIGSQVRIEDDVICGTDGPEVISSGVPSDVAAVEQLVGSDAQPLLTPM